MISRPKVLFALMLAVVLLAVACGGEGGVEAGGGPVEAGSGPVEGQGAPGQSGSIAFVHWRGEDAQVFDSIIEKFTNETGVAVNMNVLPSSAYTGQVQATLLGGQGADVFTVFPGSQFVELTDAGVFTDLSDADFIDRFEPKLLEAGTPGFYGLEDGRRQLALPYQAVFNQPIYNKTMFEQAGIGDPPEDWEGFLAACDALKELGVIPILYAGDISASQFTNPMMMNNQPDTDIWAKVEAGEARVDDDWMVTTLSQINELEERGCFQENALGSRAEGVIAQFAQENGAMLATGSYHMASVEQFNPEIEMGLLAPITVPASEAQFEGINTTTFMLAVNARGPNPEAAQQFIEFLTRPEIASEYANGTGQLLTLKDVDYETDNLQEQAQWLERDTRFQPRFLITDTGIQDGLITAVEDVLSGVSPEEAAAKFQATVERAIEG